MQALTLAEKKKKIGVFETRLHGHETGPYYPLSHTICPVLLLFLYYTMLLLTRSFIVNIFIEFSANRRKICKISVMDCRITFRKQIFRNIRIRYIFEVIAIMSIALSTYFLSIVTNDKVVLAK